MVAAKHLCANVETIAIWIGIQVLLERIEIKQFVDISKTIPIAIDIADQKSSEKFGIARDRKVEGPG